VFVRRVASLAPEWLVWLEDPHSSMSTRFPSPWRKCCRRV